MIRHFPILTSTNEYLQMLLEKEDPPEGLVIATDYQEMGKGHGGSRWESEAGMNLLVSLLLKPTFLDPSRQFTMTECISVALVHVLRSKADDHRVTIKWPNDIYIDERKIAGILIQHTIRGKEILSSIAGIGLNINQAVFPDDIPNPISLKQLTGHDLDREEILQELLEEISRLYAGLPSPAFRENLHAEYLERLYRFREWSAYSDGREFTARITGVNDYGQLMLERKDGEMLVYGFKEVTYLP